MAVDVTSDGTLVVRLGDPQNKTTLGTVPKDRTVLVVGSLEAGGSSPAQMRAALLDGEGPLPTSENDITFQTLQGAIPSDRAVALRITSWPSKDNNTSGSPEDRSIDELRIGESLESVLP